MLKTLRLVCFYLLTVFIVAACVQTEQKPEVLTKELPPAPIAEKKDSILTIHGDARVDPYFWMRLTDRQKKSENPDAQTKKVLDYLRSENEYTDKVMSHTEKLQEKLYEEMVGRIKQTDESVPYYKNEYWYYTRYEEGKEYPIHCRKKDSLEAEEEILLNVNELAEGHAYYAATGLSVSPDNKLLSFGEDKISRRIYTIRFKNLETGEFLPDRLENTSGSGAWANDNQTFFYTSKNKVSLLVEKIWKHKLGDKQAEDVLQYEEKDPSFYIGVNKSKSDKYIIIWNSSTLVDDYHILDADNPEGRFRQFSPRETAHKYSVEHFEDKFYILTNWNALNFRLMETPKDALAKENWREVIPHRPEVLLNGMEVFKNHLVLRERSNALTNLTSAEHLYARGGSAGGLLMGAVVNQAPELFKGVIAAVPFVDVVSTMLDESIPLTSNEFDEWGNPKDKDAYEYMLSYSPYDQVEAKAYPNMLVTTGLFDSQVQYWEPAKWVAKLRATKTDDNILMLHTNMEAGHGGASGRFERYKQTALQYAFFLTLEGLDALEPLKN